MTFGAGAPHSRLRRDHALLDSSQTYLNILIQCLIDCVAGTPQCPNCGRGQMSKDYVERLPATEPEPAAARAGLNADGSGLLASEAGHSNRTGAEEFLLRCLSAGRKPLAAGREPAADWSEVVAIADKHGITPLLYTRLKQSGAQTCVPADVWERLRRTHFASAIRSMSFSGGLRKVLQRLCSSGIKVIVLKGAYLAEVVYGDDALRPMADIDLLVPRAELSRAQAILLDMGGPHQQPDDIEWCYRLGSHLPPVAYLGLAIELHWAIALPTSPFRTDISGLWKRAHPATMVGIDVLALSSEDLLLHVCLHASSKHCLGEGLRPLCDISETIQRFRSEMDWAEVAERAREWGAARHMGLMLNLAQGMLGADVPDAVLEQLVPGGIDERIFEAARESVLARTGYRQWVPLLDLLGVESIGDKARLLWDRVFLSRGEMGETYPASRNSRHLYRYYALRIRDVIRTYSSHTLRRGRLMVQNRGRDRNAALVNWLSEKS